MARKIRALYIATTHDKYELPVFICDTAAELARKLDRPIGSVLTQITLGTGYVHKIEIMEGELFD